jgi:N-acetyl-gamma-glutamyl-phosphate reductase
MREPIQVGIVGVSGYTGMELLRLLAGHPVFELAAATSRQDQGRTLQELFPQLHGHAEGELELSLPDPAELAKRCSLVFLAVPHGTAMDIAAELLQHGVRVVDLSADFRLQSPDAYREWYGLPHRHPDLLSRAVYGLVELYEPRIREADLVANPGCYPTSVLLGLYPALAEGLIDPEDIIVDSKSGTSGAGRAAKTNNLFCEVYDNFKPYGLGSHRHTPEMEQELGRMSGRGLTLSFNPHLLPIDRGIVSTMYGRLNPGIDAERIPEAYRRRYHGLPWIRLFDRSTLPEARRVRGTMFCDIAVFLEERARRFIAVSAIDNLCRGASGQAVANANLMCGMEAATGLRHLPLMP